MDISWSDVKEIFFVIGSIAGVAALLRPIIETKFTRDLKRIEHVRSLINEQLLVDLEAQVEQSRMVPADHFEPFDQLDHERRTKQDSIRFTGPLADHLNKELDDLIEAYHSLRDYIQVNEWEPQRHVLPDGTERTYWQFNKAAFARETGYPKDYAEHLQKAADQAKQMLISYQRFQLVAELHLLESPIAGWLLKYRFKSHGLQARRAE